MADIAPVGQSSRFQQWHLVVVLTATYVLSQLDRGAIYLIVVPIEHDLRITDVQMSLLLGLAFVALYSLAIVPAGYLVDRTSRRLVLCAMVMFWSVSSMVSGFVRTYGLLFAARACLGLGESGLPPAAYSLLRDGVAERYRGRAFSVYQSGITLGNGLGSLIGGVIFGLSSVGVFASLPLIGHLKPWQHVMFVPGLFGMLVGALLLTIREPPRIAVAAQGDPVSFAELFRYMRRNAGVYTVIFVGTIVASLALAGWTSWIVAAMGRRHHLSPAKIGTTIGSINLVLFPLSAYAFGLLMDLVRQRWNRPSGPFWVAIGSCILNLGPAVMVLHARSLAAMWVSYGAFVCFSITSVQASCGYMLAAVTPSRLMGKTTSCYYLTNNLLAGATAPTIVATISQYGFRGSTALANALTISYSTFICLTVVVLLIGVRYIEDWHRGNPEATVFPA